MTFLRLLTRLRQVCCDPAMLPWHTPAEGESGKVEVLMEKLAGIVAAGEKVVLFSQFVTFLNRVRAGWKRSFRASLTTN
ncbi:MAG: SWF/SNF helicase family protein [Verrucomicrobiae bacterium]|nr:SWF/SNF helicase family protein [Verrucomicrobiae bacterium]